MRDIPEELPAAIAENNDAYQHLVARCRLVVARWLKHKALTERWANEMWTIHSDLIRLSTRLPDDPGEDVLDQLLKDNAFVTALREQWPYDEFGNPIEEEPPF